MKKFVCYTCCTGGYDDILQYDVLNSGWDYIFFTDNEQLIKKKRVGQWEIRPLVFNKQTNVKNARYHKINAHILFPNYEASLWLDANLIIKSKNVLDKINKLINSNAVISVPLHPERTCIYSEAEKIIELRIDYQNIVNTQMEILKNENYPTNNGLHETCIMFRKHNIMKSTLDLWWDMVDKHSKRDQLSFDYAMWKNKIEVVPFYPKGTDHHDNGDFLFRSGKNHNQNKIPEPFKIFKKVRKPNGKIKIYFLGLQIISYKKTNPPLLQKILPRL